MDIYTTILWSLLALTLQQIYRNRNSIIEKSKKYKKLYLMIGILGIPDVLYYLIFKFPKDKEMMKIIDKVTKQRKLDIYF